MVHYYGFSSTVLLEETVKMMIWNDSLTFQLHTSVTGSDELAHNDVASHEVICNKSQNTGRFIG